MSRNPPVEELKFEEVEAVTEASHTLGGSNSLRWKAVKDDEKACKEDSSAAETSS